MLQNDFCFLIDIRGVFHFTRIFNVSDICAFIQMTERSIRLCHDHFSIMEFSLVEKMLLFTSSIRISDQYMYHCRKLYFSDMLPMTHVTNFRRYCL